MGEESQMHQEESSGGKSKKVVIFLLLGLVGIIIAGGIFLSHATVQAHGFCNFCHTAYYDGKEYAFNEKIGTPKPSGILVGCAECHPQPYAEFKKSVHFETEKTDRRPGCANCHDEPHSVLLWFQYMYRQPEVWKRVQMSIYDNELWEKEVRPDLAKKARIKFVKSDSRACRGCHNEAAKTWKPTIKAHQKFLKEGGTCIKCHFNLVHGEVPWPDKDKM